MSLNSHQPQGHARARRYIVGIKSYSLPALFFIYLLFLLFTYITLYRYYTLRLRQEWTVMMRVVSICVALSWPVVAICMILLFFNFLDVKKKVRF